MWKTKGKGLRVRSKMVEGERDVELLIVENQQVSKVG